MRLLHFASLFIAVGTASAAPKPMVKYLPSAKPRIQGAPIAAASSRILFVHRCPEILGCPVKTGSVDDSRTDTSSIITQSSTIGPFTRGNETWNAVMACARETYAPFNIEVTDVDPGNVPHFEVLVGGDNTDFGAGGEGAGGLAPATCSEIPNAISYVFDVWGNNADVICSVIGQESAHAFGLEHEMLPEDPMTYLSGPDKKRFRAEDAQCGEFEARSCRCGGQTQNSYQHLLALFGAGVPVPPTVAIKSPAVGKTVQPGFVTRVDATDEVKVIKVELLIDGVVVGETTAPPFNLKAPLDVAQGPHTIEARATDIQNGTATSAPVDVDLGPPCTAASGCESTDVCVMGLCVAGPDDPGGLGTSCQLGRECDSDSCVMDSTGAGFCVEACDLSPGSCPSGFDCVAAGSAGVCFPGPDAGCCDTGVRGTNPAGPLLLAFGLGALMLRRRRA
ncbi:MAG: Ig-like domain-containing protein [Deltaproteobacteria bacterium]|nr:Ig-like domain-containing protein [Deltaproteobacteria bacterium]